MESIKNIVAQNCKRLLGKSVNLTEISRLMQIHASTISRWKSGDHAPELDKIDRLAHILNVDPSEFFKSPVVDKTKSGDGLGGAIEILQKMSSLSDRNRNLILKQIDQMLLAEEVNRAKANKEKQA